MKMMYRFILAIPILVFVALTAVAQSSDCPAGPGYTHADFEFTSLADLKTRLAEFEQTLGSLPSTARGGIYVFGGSRSTIDEVDKLQEIVQSALTLRREEGGYRVWTLDGGFRTKASIVLMIEPAPCSRLTPPVADLTADNVAFEGFSPASTLRLSGSELYETATTRPEPDCPPAARAVRACDEDTTSEVFVLVDESGNVVFAKAISGHPLVRMKAVVTLKSWKFAPLKRDGRTWKRSGVVLLRFKKPAQLDY